jgi:putative FmdB family regulatory protein
MPIYEYDCPKCGEFEYRQSMSDPALKKCPSCRSKVTKLMSASGFQLKGGGWYADSYQKKNGSAPAASTASDTSTAAAAPSTDSAASTKVAAD